METTRDVEEFRAYYYSLYGTGESAIDGVLRVVARAGKAYHSTSQWTDQPWNDPDGSSEVDKIQAAAEEAAAEIRRLRSDLEEAVKGEEALRIEVEYWDEQLERRDAALQEIADSGRSNGVSNDEVYTTGDGHADCIEIARRALATGGDE